MGDLSLFGLNTGRFLASKPLSPLRGMWASTGAGGDSVVPDSACPVKPAYVSLGWKAGSNLSFCSDP